jgi:hypothetical protein
MDSPILVLAEKRQKLIETCQPQISLNEGLNLTTGYFKSLLKL